MSDQAAREFVEHLIGLRNYWVSLGKDPKETADGLLFSVFSTLDGCSASSPAFNVSASLHPDDEKDAWLPFKDGEVINEDVMLHELYSAMTRRNTQETPK